MESFYWVRLVLVLSLGLFLGALCQDDSDSNITAVYIVTLKQAPAVHHFEGELVRGRHGSRHGLPPGRMSRFHKPRNHSRSGQRSSSYLARVHDSLLRRVLRGEKYLKLYSYHYLINGFSVLVTPEQADKLLRRREVANVVLDFSVRTATTHTPQFLGLPKGAWVQEGGYETAGEGIVIGFIDTGIVSCYIVLSFSTPPSPEDSKILLKYYNSSLGKGEPAKKIGRFGAVARISGGLKANYGSTAPKIMFFSARGPDPEDSFLDDADIMKPNVVAPGNLIWAAWSSRGTDSVEFQGENFAMMSGTSMAAPHIAGLAALIKHKFPTFSPSAIGSALSTTASLCDNNGGPIMAQRAYANPDQNQSPATPFDMGSGFVNATAALDPGLIFDASKSNRFYIAGNETYSVGWSSPYGVSVKVSPTHFFIASGERQVLTIIFNATGNSSVASFGRIGLFGKQGHIINLPLSVIVKISYNSTSS
ncbi:subtilisin-like protease SBT2.2 [Carica papaya]|uniref:subtilisin-like protease SBT2.2 n=1 Tax=Carica papaya TaxID=3649 RepID=UPI000B8C9F78|nr:subtilisin-like protease SBT2.2 [Carica papaya]